MSRERLLGILISGLFITLHTIIYFAVIVFFLKQFGFEAAVLLGIAYVGGSINQRIGELEFEILEEATS
jgi:hypothetical protein